MSIDGGLRKLFHTHLPGHWQAIELGPVGSGVPDTNYCIDGHEGWVEFKGTATSLVEIRPHQIAWAGRRVRAGGRVWLAVRQQHDGGPRKGPPIDRLWLIRGSQIETVARDGLNPQLVAAFIFEGGPRHWDWDEVAKILCEDSTSS